MVNFNVTDIKDATPNQVNNLNIFLTYIIRHNQWRHSVDIESYKKS